jgi:hypothetical protein
MAVETTLEEGLFVLLKVEIRMRLAFWEPNAKQILEVHQPIRLLARH